MKEGHKKYRAFSPTKRQSRRWPDVVLTHAPIWCSVDLRDGNQALINPMSLDDKISLFRLLCSLGVKEIEVGFPSASLTEFDTLRALIEHNFIPDDVTIQVLVQAREHLIRRTFEAIDGAKNVIIHFYNSTSALQRKVVFHTDMQGIVDIAVNGARLIRQLGDEHMVKSGANLRYEYSPESYMGTEPENALWICQRVMEELGATAEHPVILNLPSTVENCLPNQFADLIEDFCEKLPNRDAAIISLHPHNDRGTATATAELGLLAGAERLECTLFGNGERTGNCDFVTVALNLFTQGIDPQLDFSNIAQIRALYERITRLPVHERHPYAGDLVFTAFSGSHQDAINKGHAYARDHDGEFWEIPYLPIDPADVGRQYEPVVRINSQSGKGGAAFVMEHHFGYHLPKAMHPEFGGFVQTYCETVGREVTPDEVLKVFQEKYSNSKGRYVLKSYRSIDTATERESVVEFEGTLQDDTQTIAIHGAGNGPIDAACQALNQLGLEGYHFVNYAEHAIGEGSAARGVAYVQLSSPDGRDIFGVGESHNTSKAAIRAVICALNRA